MVSMKRSAQVPALLVGAIAATLLAGCDPGPREVRRCVDENGKLLPDQYCENRRTYAGYTGIPRYVYGGQYDARTSSVRNFRNAPMADSTITNSSGRVIRSGFGSTGARGFGGIG